jgi:hypothetical protein
MKPILPLHKIAACFVVLVVVSAVYGQSKPPQPVQGLTVVDSTGKPVGNVIGFSGASGDAPVVAFKVDGTLAVVLVGSNGFLPFGYVIGPNYVFALPDCGGTPYLTPCWTLQSTGPETPTAVFSDKVYTLPPNTQPQSAFVQSFGYFGNGGPYTLSCINFPGVVSDNLTPLQFLIDLDKYYTPPFSLR